MVEVALERPSRGFELLQVAVQSRATAPDLVGEIFDLDPSTAAAVSAQEWARELSCAFRRVAIVVSKAHTRSLAFASCTHRIRNDAREIRAVVNRSDRPVVQAQTLAGNARRHDRQKDALPERIFSLPLLHFGALALHSIGAGSMSAAVAALFRDDDRRVVAANVFDFTMVQPTARPSLRGRRPSITMGETGWGVPMRKQIRRMVRRSSLAGFALVIVVLASVIAIAATAAGKDGPAWVQAILSGAAVLVTALLWQLDKQREVAQRLVEQDTLQGVVSGSIQELKRAAIDILALCENYEGQFLPPHLLLDALRRVQHRFQHLKLFSPYDRLGEFALVNMCAEVEVCTLTLLEAVDAPEARSDGYAVRVQQKHSASWIVPRCQELVTRCDMAIVTLHALSYEDLA